MQHIYTVNPVECQPQWDAEPEPIHYPWSKGLLAAAVVAVGFLIALDIISAVFLLGGGS